MVPTVITCCLHYKIDPFKLDEFEAYARMWLPLVERFGGTHRGYFLPHEGANDVAIALFDFASLADYEAYRQRSLEDPDCRAARDYAERTRCIRTFERTFLRPMDPLGVALRATGTGSAANSEGLAEVIDINDAPEG